MKINKSKSSLFDIDHKEIKNMYSAELYFEPNLRTEEYKPDMRQGILGISIGVLLLFLGVVFYLTEHGGILNFLILNSPGAIITGLGIYFLYRHNHPEYVKRINKRKYIKFQRKLEKNHDKIIHSLEKQSRIIRMKASKHRGLMWDVYFRRTVYFGLASVILVLLAFFNIAPFYVAALIIALCAFIYSVSGMGYRKTLKAYEAVYKSAAETKESYKKSNVYHYSFETLSIGEEFVMSTQTSRTVIPVREIVWIYCEMKMTDNYKNYDYKGTTVMYKIYLYTENGESYDFYCTESQYVPIIDDILEKGTMITAGFSSYLYELYKNEPLYFRTSKRTEPNPSPYKCVVKHDYHQSHGIT